MIVRSEIATWIFYFCGFIIFLSANFVNDFNVNGYFGFYLFWLLTVGFRLITQIKLTKPELYAQFTVFILISPLLIIEILKVGGISDYYHSYFISILFVNIFFLLPYLTSQPTKFMISGGGVLIIFLSALAYRFFTEGWVREPLIFGPNVLYRLYSFLVLIIFVSFFLRKRKPSFIVAMILVSIWGLLLLSTGSRGGVAVFLVLLIYYFFISTSSVSSKIFGVMAFGSVLLFTFFSLVEVMPRIVSIDLENASELERLKFLFIFKDFLFNSSETALLTGLSSVNSVLYTYPHNIVIEGFIYSGVLGGVISVAAILLMLKFLSKVNDRKSYNYLAILYIPFLIGAQFSGNNFYNFQVIVVPIILLFMSSLLRR